MYLLPVNPRSQLLTQLILSSLLLGACVQATAATVKVAFVADQGIDANAQAVLSMIAAEGTDLLLLQGDFGYLDDAADQWEQNLVGALGADFPVLSVVGNHENDEWASYKQSIRDRVSLVEALTCSGRVGIKAFCQFGPIDIVQVSPGIREIEGIDPDDDYAGFITESFAASSGRWRICSWHKNQRDMQTGRKDDETGWAVYEACREAGALVITGHEHAYSRTHLLSDFENQVVVHKDKDMLLQSGQSIAVVSGLGGWQIREQVRDAEWWAAIYTKTQGAAYGALFCEFAESTANCYFKAIDGSVPDQFNLRLPEATETTDVTDADSSPAPEPITPQEITPEPAEVMEPVITAEPTELIEPITTPEPAEQIEPVSEPVVEPGPEPPEEQVASLQPLVNENENQLTDEQPAAADLAEPVVVQPVSRGSLSWVALLALFAWPKKENKIKAHRHRKTGGDASARTAKLPAGQGTSNSITPNQVLPSWRTTSSAICQ